MRLIVPRLSKDHMGVRDDVFAVRACDAETHGRLRRVERLGEIAALGGGRILLVIFGPGCAHNLDPFLCGLMDT